MNEQAFRQINFYGFGVRFEGHSTNKTTKNGISKQSSQLFLCLRDIKIADSYLYSKLCKDKDTISCFNL